MTATKTTRRLPISAYNAWSLARAIRTKDAWYTSRAESQALAQRLVDVYGGDKHEAAKAIWSTVAAINNWLAGRKRMTLANARVVERAVKRVEEMR